MLTFWLVGFGTMVMLYLRIYRGMPSNIAVDYRFFGYLTIRSVAWWVAVGVCIAIGFGVSYWWRGPLSLWVFLAVTDLVPAGALALFVVLLSKAQEAIRSNQ
ncbi:MAG TPA: hypothetical protein VN933_11800 [Candidatus Eremiobacteraceae bacterium]|nr:hypothetical protein [Candidatus Eremiobacteraceae bacterium]